MVKLVPGKMLARKNLLMADVRDSVRHFLPTIIAVSIIRLSCATLLYLSLTSLASHALEVPFMNIVKVNSGFNWLYLFSNWDTGNYVGIAVNWYPTSLSPLWAFFPLYPATIRVVSLFDTRPLLSAFLISTGCGVVSVAMFQNLVEMYMPKSRGFVTTILYFLFPPVLVFSSVSYSEELFLMFTLLTWILHKKSMNGWASLSACLCTLTRVTGILIILPILFDNLRMKQFRVLRYLTLPIAALLGWLWYGYVMTGDFFVPLTVTHYWIDQNALLIQSALVRLLTGDLSALPSLSSYARLGVEAVIYIGIIVFFAFRSYRIDRALAFYSFASIFSIICLGFVTAYLSFPRLLSFVFPIGLSMYSRNRLLVATVVALCVLVDLIAWRAFIVDAFY